MRNRLGPSLLVLAGFLPGCGAGSSNVVPSDLIGPHRGTLIKLPEGKGYAEVLNAGDSRGRPSARDRGNAAVLVYFLNPELKGPATVSPSEVNVKLTIVTDHPVSVQLDPAADAKDPLGQKRFLSKTGPYLINDVHGELSASLDGQPFTAEFDGVR